jgi:hypothetical protein
VCVAELAAAAGVPGVPGVDGAADVAVPARAPRMRPLPRAPRLLPRLPHYLLLRAQPRHGRGMPYFIVYLVLF